MLVRRDVNATIVSSILTFDLNWLEVVSIFFPAIEQFEMFEMG